MPDKYKNNNEFLTREELTEIGSILDTNENFKKYLCEKYETQRELIRKYFQQEIDSSDEHWAIVDAFGSGYTQTCFKAILKKIYDKPVKTFYLSLSIYKTLEDNYCYCHCHFISSMIEIFLRAPHGVTLNYTCGNQGTVIPVLDKNETDDIIIKEPLEDYQSINYKSSLIDITYFFKNEVNKEELEENIKKLKDSIERRKKLLSNENYVNKAPKNIVDLDREKLKEEEAKLKLLEEQL